MVSIFSKNLLEVKIPNVKSISMNTFEGSSVEKIVLESTAPSGGARIFQNAGSLREVVIDQMVKIPANFFFVSAIQILRIPPVTESIGKNVLSNCPNLTTVRYDAKNAKINANAIEATTVARFELTIGKDVDVLNKEFCEFAQQANTIVFEGENQITIAEGAMAGAPAPLCDLSGTIYVDEQGVVYTYDDSGATLFFCPPGVEELEVPATLPEMAGSCPVTAVRKDALKYAENLESITFADPAGIKKLDTLAMANCMTLTRVNGFDNETEAAASFANAEMGYNVFYNTGLKGAKNGGTFEQDMSGRKGLTVTGSNAADLHITTTCESWGGEGETGGYKLLTGEDVTITCATGTTIENQTARYRVYFRFTSEEGYSSVDPDAPEPWATINGWRMDYHATEDPYTVYAEFGAPPEGSSMGLPINVY